jgi:hypothetical protein
MAHHLVAAYADDVRVQSTGGEPAHKYDAKRVNVHEVEPGVICRDDRVSVTAFAVKHGAWPQALRRQGGIGPRPRHLLIARFSVLVTQEPLNR